MVVELVLGVGKAQLRPNPVAIPHERFATTRMSSVQTMGSDGPAAPTAPRQTQVPELRLQGGILTRVWGATGSAVSGLVTKRRG